MSTQSDDVSSSTSTNQNILQTITTIIGKTASLTVSVSFFILLAYHRNATILTVWIGSILNAILSKIVKKIVNQNRPSELYQTNSSNVKLKPSDGGMPSSHAMSLGFIITSILIVDNVLPINKHYLRAGVGLLMSLYTTIALQYRIRDHYHTIEQVAVGLVFGVMNAIAWFKFAMVGLNNTGVGPVLSYVQQNWITTETGLLPYIALIIPIIVGMVVVGSFERQISLWMTNNKSSRMKKEY